MEIYADVDWIDGFVRYGHIEGNVDFSEEEQEDFENLLRKDLNNEENFSDEEFNRLDDYKERILNRCHIVVDDFEIEDWGGICWKDFL